MSARRIWKFVVEKPAAAGVILTLGLAIVGGLWAVYQEFRPAAPIDVVAIVEILAESARQKGVLEEKLEGAQQREEERSEQIRQLTEAVEALTAERGQPDAPQGIDDALDFLAKGETGAAEAVFEEVKARRKAEGEGAFKEAAAAARHIGALAFLHDTDKALAAYREAVALDPDDPDGWNRLGQLLRRTGDLDGATEAYNRVLSLGNRTTDRATIAIATGNLGILYTTRGELDRAEEMYRKSLEINEALGRREGMASDYGNLGILYATRGEIDRAEEMFRKSLELNEALGRKEGMASDYGNLGNLYQTRGELDRAEEMYRKSLELFREIGAVPMIEKTEGLLADLRKSE